jgi:organic radical activating enzyme
MNILQKLKEDYTNNKIKFYIAQEKIDDKISISIKLAKTCNLNCWFCIQGQDPKIKKNFNDIEVCNKRTYELINKLNAEFKKLKNKKIEIIIHGGETFLFDIPGFMEHLEPYDNKIIIKAYTNGTLVNQIHDAIKNEKKNLKIGLSLSIHESEVNPAIIMKNLNFCKDHIKEINIVSVGNNRQFIDDFKKAYPDFKIKVQSYISPNKTVSDKIEQEKDTMMYYMNNELQTRGKILNIIKNTSLIGFTCIGASAFHYNQEKQCYETGICPSNISSDNIDNIILNERICSNSSHCTLNRVRYIFKI